MQCWGLEQVSYLDFEFSKVAGLGTDSRVVVHPRLRRGKDWH